MTTYVGQVFRSHKGRGPDRVQVIKIVGDRVTLRYLNSRRRKDFELQLWFLGHPSCGWVLDQRQGATTPKGGSITRPGGTRA
jgi:hypothetical protein